ncbi:protein-disulfide reductase DsbD [Geothrix sp. 21YS21S-2]|uniref:protein-disulfide reductase DsbD family protein n=1 Tax=Geothrix sp. 21YS21S-2 TaxID=3068893 RepID=UPI0027B8E294|nr:cytochrome c biogenesis protein CcdA [Geothrix sp. 21YS21S-2]
MRGLPAFLTALLLMACSAVQAQSLKGFDPERDVQVVLRKGAVVVTVPQGAHLKASFMSVALKEGAKGTLKAGPMPPTREKDELGDGIWHDRVVIPVAGEGLKGDVELVVEYQPCTEGQGGVCFPPTDKVLKVKATEIPALAGKAPAAADPAPVPPAEAKAPAPPAPAPAPAASPAPASRENLFLIFLGVFAAGLLASLTPCVFPMIPITMAVIGAKGGGKARGFALSIALVLGMAVTYTTLGVVAARTGAAFGAFAQRPAFLVPVAVIFGLFALSLFGAFEIRLPDALQQRLQGSGSRKGFLGAFLVGLVLGPLSAPCVGPVIGTVLLAIALKGDVLLGAAELFTFSLGMGVLFVITGTFTAALPRSGDWLEKLKQFMGLLVLGFAVWVVRLILPLWIDFALWSLVLLIAASFLGAFQPAATLAAGVRKGLGILALAIGVLLGVLATAAGLDLKLPAAAAPAAGAAQTWLEQDLEGALAKAKAGNKVVLVDIYADWCAQCKELDENTWPDPAVASWIRENAVAIRIDTDRVRKDLAGKLQIRSYPTVILLDAEGRELRRSMGFQKPGEMLKFLKG